MTATGRPGPAGHVVLVGLPGAGKSTVGPLLAEALGRAFVDFDAELVRRTGRTVATLVEELGEGAFRQMEAELTEELAGEPPAVFAPGGGWVVRPDNVARLRPPALLVWLRLPPDEALTRLAGDPVTRPLLAGPEPLARLETLARERARAYAGSDLVVDVAGVPPEGVLRRLLDALPVAAAR